MDKHAGPQLRAWLVPRVKAADLAREAGVSHQYLSNVLNGRKPPSQKILDAAGRLGIPVDAILGDKR